MRWPRSRRGSAMSRIGVDLFEGMSLGSILLLAAIGLSITFGVMGVINMAHGEMIMLGAYSDLSSCSRSFAPSCRRRWLDAYLIVVAAGRASRHRRWSASRSSARVIRFLYGRPLETLLATWGISLILQQARAHASSARRQPGGRQPRLDDRRLRADRRLHLTWNRLVIICLLLRRAGRAGAGAEAHRASACTCAR